MTVAPFAKPGSREDLRAKLAAWNDGYEADFVIALEGFQAVCRNMADNPDFRPGIRNIARVLLVHLDREGKALKSIRGQS